MRWLHHRDICWVVIVHIHNCGRAVHCDRAFTCGRAVPCGWAGDWAETCGLETPVMKMMRGIDDRPKNDADDDERKSSTDGCPTPSRHCRTRHVYASWHHQRNLAGPARSLSSRCCGRPRDDWCLGDSWRFSSPCLRLRSGILDLQWSDLWELGRPTAVTLEATDLGWEELVAVFDRLALDESSDLVRLVGKASLGVCNSTESSIISLSFFAAFAVAGALRRFLCAVALARLSKLLAASLYIRNRDCLECRVANHHSNGTIDSGGGYHSCVGNGSTQETLAAIRLTMTCHVTFPPFSLAGTAYQRRKHGFKTCNLLYQNTPETNWRVF